MWLEFGPARAKATVTNGVVTSIAVANAGFGYSYAPRIKILGGSIKGDGLNLSNGYPGTDSPSNIATAHCVMTGSAPNMTIASIVVDNGGAGYSNDSRAAPRRAPTSATSLRRALCSTSPIRSFRPIKWLCFAQPPLRPLSVA